jgi:hypothetical protein
LVDSNQGNYFENATAISNKRTLKTTVATQLNEAKSSSLLLWAFRNNFFGFEWKNKNVKNLEERRHF